MKACCALKKLQGKRLDAGGWLVSGGLLLLVPKCPVCLAAYVAAFTGLGLSLSAATGLRWAMIALCGASLGFLTIRLIRNLMRKTAGSNGPFERTDCSKELTLPQPNLLQDSLPLTK